MKQSRGYILPLTIMIISMAVMLITSIIQRSTIYQRQARITQDREAARNLALSAMELALSKISFIVPKKAEAAGQKETKEKIQTEATQKTEGQKLEPLQRWLLQFLPILNKWQTLELTDTEGVTGTISFYITSEQGKFDLLYLNDLEAQEAKKKQPAGQEKAPEGAQDKEKAEKEKTEKEEASASAKATADTAKGKEVQQKTASQQEKNPLNKLDEVLKKETGVSIKQVLKEGRERYKGLYDDPTQLVVLKSFAPLKDALFVTKQPTSPKGKTPLYVTDLFTTGSSSGTLNPWVLSASVKAALGFKENKEVKINAQFIKNLKPTMQWQTEWDKVFAPLYGKKFNTIPQELRSIFNPQFEANAFLVVAYGQVGAVTQKIAVKLEATEPQPHLSPESKVFKVTKLYWL